MGGSGHERGPRWQEAASSEESDSEAAGEARQRRRPGDGGTLRSPLNGSREAEPSTFAWRRGWNKTAPKTMSTHKWGSKDTR